MNSKSRVVNSKQIIWYLFLIHESAEKWKRNYSFRFVIFKKPDILPIEDKEEKNDNNEENTLRKISITKYFNIIWNHL